MSSDAALSEKSPYLGGAWVRLTIDLENRLSLASKRTKKGLACPAAYPSITGSQPDPAVMEVASLRGDR